jgi:hypothetical protein
MVLLDCPECGNQVSDKASACPKCGFPLTGSASKESTYVPSEIDWYQAVGREVSDEELENLSSDEFGDLLNATIDGSMRPLDINVGRLIKKRVRIDAETIAFGSKTMKCSSVKSIGWWVQTTKQIEWAQGEWTTGWVWIRNRKKTMKITVPGSQEFQAVTQKVWSFVGRRLLSDFARVLDKEHQLTLCGLKLSAEGIELGKFASGKEVVPWKSITSSTYDGKLHILYSSRAGKKRKASLSYRHSDNVPVLASLLKSKRFLRGLGSPTNCS